MNELPKIGDAVYLVGFPDYEMTVGYCSAHGKHPHDGVSVLAVESLLFVPCTWFDKDGKLQAVWFHNGMLKLVNK